MGFDGLSSCPHTHRQRPLFRTNAGVDLVKTLDCWLQSCFFGVARVVLDCLRETPE